MGWRVERCSTHVEMLLQAAILRTERGWAPICICSAALLELSCFNHLDKQLAEGSACLLLSFAIYNCILPTTHSFVQLVGFVSLQTSPPIPQGDSLRAILNLPGVKSHAADNLNQKVCVVWPVAPRILAT